MSYHFLSPERCFIVAVFSSFSKLQEISSHSCLRIPVTTMAMPGSWVSIFTLEGQNAVQRLLILMLEEHSCRIGLVGQHNLLLFGSDILTRDIAAVRASINPQSCSSNLDLEPSDDKSGLQSSLRKPLAVILDRSDSNSVARVSCWEVSVTWSWNFDFGVSSFCVGSV